MKISSKDNLMKPDSFTLLAMPICSHCITFLKVGEHLLSWKIFKNYCLYVTWLCSANLKYVTVLNAVFPKINATVSVMLTFFVCFEWCWNEHNINTTYHRKSVNKTVVLILGFHVFVDARILQPPSLPAVTSVKKNIDFTRLLKNSPVIIPYCSKATVAWN